MTGNRRAAIERIVADVIRQLSPLVGALDGLAADPQEVQRRALFSCAELRILKSLLDEDSVASRFVEEQGPEWVRRSRGEE